MSGKIFISHCHADKEVASVIRNNLIIWGVNKDDIYQSSHEDGGAIIGQNLHQQIRRKLNEADIVIMIYTTSDQDWEYCMWECGVATSPDPEKEDRTVIVFQCTDDPPKVLNEYILVKALDSDDLKKFVKQIITSKEIWKNAEPLRQEKELPDDILKKINDNFKEELHREILKVKSMEIPRWDYFTLEMDFDNRTKLFKLNEDKNWKEIQSIITDNCKVVDKFGEVLKHFGCNDLLSDMFLKDLIQKWSNKGKRSKLSDDWIPSICKSVWRALRNDPSIPCRDFIRSIKDSKRSFLIILNHVSEVHGVYQFKFYLYEIPEIVIAEVFKGKKSGKKTIKGN